ncbi:uncharacterized protein LAESUDRAFT_645315 [Laetiporus sulphureus 93-53]|uniref:Translation machinery-associated protein 16 n=1 Tax=Laetiporus sulphureus 93-53 TaxID=1314785 RepID=A0A165GB17_9APHY|nr:uncharacterized protein LAESUDRAFT_645315 [Laetiporus sulphureus 93-53]KZT10096.1 hypothetical protein LAESUDRAFT_645315 [Laetiporus sulphureus 93-53]
MAPPKEGKKKAIAQKKEKLFHPQSRKAEQLARVQHRKSKLEQVAKARSEKQRSQVDIYSFFYHAMPADGVLSLEDLHKIIESVWLTRFDGKLEEERKSRRKGRPKSVKEQKLEELKLREAEEYRTGLEVIDLTYPPNVELFRRWDRKAVEFIQQLRFIRISSDSPSVAVVSRPGKHPSLLESKDKENSARDEHMDIDEAPLLMEPLSRFSSTITAMDGPSTS